MTRQNLFHKWFVYGLGLALVWLMDVLILPRFPVFGLTPMLLPSAVVAVAVLEGAHAGTGFGLAVGLLWELTYPGGFGGLVVFLALVGLATGALAQFVLSQSLPSCLLCTAGTLLLLDGLRVFRGLMSGAADLSALLRVAVPECILSLCWTPAVYLLFLFIFRRVGGAKLA